MKNFSKKLSFVMATAMVVTSLYAPQNAEAAVKNAVVVAGSKKAVKSKFVYVGGASVDFDAIVKGKNVKNGSWKTSNKKVASVDKKGVVKGLKNGTAVISFKTKATKKAKSVTLKVKVMVYTRAAKMTLTPSAVVVKEGESADVTASLSLSKKVKAAGGKTSTYKLFAESSDETAATVTVDGNKITVKGVAKSATPATITVYAAQSKNLEAARKAKTKLTEKFEVKVNSKFDAKQVKANKILVNGAGLTTSAAAYAVKSVNGVVVNLKDKVEVNAEGTVATLEAVVAQLQEGKYTVKVGTEEAEFTAVKAMVDKIVVKPEDKAIIKGRSGVDAKIAYAYYSVLDNFGEDVTNEPLGANIYANGVAVAKKGEVKFEQDTPFLINNSKLSLVLVDQNSGKNVSATLTVSDEAMLSEITFKGVYDKKNKKIVETLEERADLKNYVLLFSGKDQYDRAKNDVDKLQVTIGGATGLKVETTKPEQVKIDGTEYMTFSLGMFTQDKLNAGEATVQAFSLANGKQSPQAKFNVVASAEVKTLSISNGPKTIVAGEDAELSFSAADADGKPVTDFDVLSRVKLTGGKNGTGLRFEKRAGKVVLLYTPAAQTNITRAVPEFVSYITKTYNVGNTTLTVNPARVPTKISGLKKDTATGVTGYGDLANAHVLYVTSSSIVLKDQYGDDLGLDKLGTYKLKVDFGTRREGVFATYGAIDGTGVKEFTAADLATDKNIVKAVATSGAVESGSVDVRLSLLDSAGKDVEGSKYDFRISSVKIDDLRDVKVEDIHLAQANADGTATRKAGISVSGTFDGKKIALVNGQDYEIITGSDVVPEEKTLKDDATVGKAIASVVVLDGKGTRLNKEYEYSKKKPVATVAEIQSGDAGKLDNAAAITVANVLNAIKVKDQYDNVLTITEAFVTFSNCRKEAVIEKNGSKEAKITSGLLDGDVITVKVTFPGSTYVFEKDFTIK